MTDDDGDEWTVKVFRDDPAWDQYPRWFMVPAGKLAELYVTAYTFRQWGYPNENSPAIREVRKLHPNAVLVY